MPSTPRSPQDFRVEAATMERWLSAAEIAPTSRAGCSLASDCECGISQAREGDNCNVVCAAADCVLHRGTLLASAFNPIPELARPPRLAYQDLDVRLVGGVEGSGYGLVLRDAGDR